MLKNSYMEKIGLKAEIASKDLLNLDEKKRNAVLKQFCINLKKNKKIILKANKKDLLKANKIKKSMLDRLILNNKKIDEIIKSVNKIIKFKNPLGRTLDSWKRPNGLIIKKIQYQ